jgi:arylsulfatase A-like enzyme
MLPAAATRPNIVLILADDLGFGDLGCYGQQKIRTPNIDRLAKEGMLFRQAYSGSTVCAPSRCTLMTGMHTGHSHVRGNMPKGGELPLRPQDTTVAELLQRSGYHTGLFGKWGLGRLGSSGYPLRKGFDEFFGFFSQTAAHNAFPEHMLDGEGEYHLLGNMGTQRKEYGPELAHQRALDFLSRQKKEKPFFLHYTSIIPHANNELGRDTPNGMEAPDLGPYANESWPIVEKTFAGAMHALDRQVGEILTALQKQGMDQNTLVLFTSDNGPHREGRHDADFFDSNGPLRGTKRDLHEGGIRVPALARWPGTIAPGSTSEHRWCFYDFLPTACDLAGLPAPKQTDGISFQQALLGRKNREHDYLYWEFHESGFFQALRIGDWKAVKDRNGAIEIYDLKSDIGEQRDLALEQPRLVAKTKDLFASARTKHEIWPGQ